MSITELDRLVSVIENWRDSPDERHRELFSKFSSIYDVRVESGLVVVPHSFVPKVSSWMSHLPLEESLQAVSSQRIISICNKVLEVEVLFNALRQKRPRPQSRTSERLLIDKITTDDKSLCDFCSYKQFTAEDAAFGRIETEHAVTAANVFKINAWNSLVIFRSHHPLSWTEAEFLDAVTNTAKQWFHCVHRRSPEHRLPCITWDLLPNGGASQLHCHLHLMLNKDKYPGGLEYFKQRTARYKYADKETYFNIDQELHDELRLSVRLGNAVALTSLTPLKDNEVIILCQQQDDLNFYRLLYCVIRAFIDDMEKFGLSIAITLPPLTMTSGDNNQTMPMIGRILTRGPFNSIVSDVCSLDFFTAPSISSDPFATTKVIQQRVEKYKVDCLQATSGDTRTEALSGTS